MVTKEQKARKERAKNAAKQRWAKAAIDKGITPLEVKPNGKVAVVKPPQSGIEIMEDVAREAEDIRLGLKPPPKGLAVPRTLAEPEELLHALVMRHGIGLTLEALENACARAAREARTVPDRARLYRALAAIVELEGALP